MLARDPTQRAAKRHFWAPYAIPTTLPGLIFASSPLPANAWVQGGHVLRERAAVTINAEDPNRDLEVSPWLAALSHALA